MKKSIIMLLFATSLIAARNDELSLSFCMGSPVGLSNIAWHMFGGLELKYNLEILNYKRVSILPGAGIYVNFNAIKDKLITTNIDCIVNYELSKTNKFYFVINPTYYTLWNDPFTLRDPDLWLSNYDDVKTIRTNHIFDLKCGFRWKIISLLAGLNTFELKAIF